MGDLVGDNIIMTQLCVWRRPGFTQEEFNSWVRNFSVKGKRRGVADATSATKEEDVEEEGEFVAEDFEEGVEDDIGVDEEV